VIIDPNLKTGFYYLIFVHTFQMPLKYNRPSDNRKERDRMGYAAGGCYSGGMGTSTAVVLVLFILLVIITSAFVW
jgi:uncharacterized protein (TIGR01732 family)